MTPEQVFTGLSGIFLPLFVAVVQKRHFSDQLRAAIGFLGIFAWTLLEAFYLNRGVPTTWDWRDWLTLLGVTAISAWASYQNLWKPLGVTGAIERKVMP